MSLPEPEPSLTALPEPTGNGGDAETPSVNADATLPASAPNSATVAAGWYQDHSQPGQQRYWDGMNWTDHTMPNATSTKTDTTWAALAHVGGLAASFLGAGLFGWLPPLLIMTTEGTKDTFVRENAVNALNFQLSVLIYGIFGLLLCLVFIGFLLLPLLGIYTIVAAIIATVKASEGEAWVYPGSIRFVK